MKTWIIEPRDPLIVRDGRPFGTIPGARSTSLDFPFPSTIAGAVRTRDGLNAGGFDTANIQRLKQLAVCGPLLVQLDETSGRIMDWFVQAPADSLLLSPGLDEKVEIKQLEPLSVGAGTTNLDAPLTPVGAARPQTGKPLEDRPRFWDWKRFEEWLVDPRDCEERLEHIGVPGLVQEQRSHVSIDPASQTNLDGALFQTRGLEFTQGGGLGRGKRLALALATDAPNVTGALAPLGGERRLVWWRESTAPAIDLFAMNCPAPLSATVAHTGHCRVILLTPAHFQDGSRPHWLCRTRHGVSAEVEAMALGRAQVVSGWDLEIGRPKRTRRLAPAGTVLFLSLKGSEAEIGNWIANTWLRCVSDDPQDRLDGFGLAAIGAWDGQPKEVA